MKKYSRKIAVNHVTGEILSACWPRKKFKAYVNRWGWRPRDWSFAPASALPKTVASLASSESIRDEVFWDGDLYDEPFLDEIDDEIDCDDHFDEIGFDPYAGTYSYDC